MYEYLIGVGAMRAGTTTLYDLLRAHPSIRTGRTKELHYFDKKEHPSKAEYDALFGPGEGIKLDITPRYLFMAEAEERIARTLDISRCAIVVLLRDPIERAFSHYKMNRMVNVEDKPFEECLDLEKERTARPGDENLRRYSYFQRGLYARQLDKLISRFPCEQIKVLLFEDFIRDPQGTVDEICDFAGLGRFQVRPVHSNASVAVLKNQKLDAFFKKAARLLPRDLMRTPFMLKLKYLLRAANRDKSVKLSIDPAFLARLKDYFREDVIRLRDEYGLDISKWKNFQDLS